MAAREVVRLPSSRSLRRGALDPTIFNLLNFWPCSGLYDADLRPKPGVREHWPL